MTRTPYQEAVDRLGKETVDKVSRRAVDPETGYVARHLNEAGVTTFLSPIRCCRCGGYGMWEAPGSHQVLCLKCQDEWMECGSKYLRKHHYVWSKKKWIAAFNEFLQTKPKEIDVAEHNRRIKSDDHFIRTMLPQYFEKKTSV